MPSSHSESPPLLYACGCVKVTVNAKGTLYLRRTTFKKINDECSMCKNERHDAIENIQNTLDLMYHGLVWSGGDDDEADLFHEECGDR